jgi:hypothetical protein
MPLRCGALKGLGFNKAYVYPTLPELLRNMCRPLKQTRDSHLHLPSHEWLGLDMLSLRDGRMVAPRSSLDREFRTASPASV